MEHSVNSARTPRQHIESILQDYQHPGAERATRNLINAVRIIGERLNRQDIHFVAELVQNAEDAGRRSGGTDIRLSFDCDQRRIIAQNDGQAFDQIDVDSICDTAASSKRHAENQIGFMGIGFKSVFKITDAPEIHSAGYSFAIRDYIFPHWLESSSNLPEPGMHSAFVLPFKPGVGPGRLAAQLDQLDPAMLLFLTALKRVDIRNQVTGQTKHLSARTLSSGDIQLETALGQQLWRLAQFAIPETNLELRPADRARSAHEAIQIACLINSEGQFQRLARGARFFAFLPTEDETGLGFHVQANFAPTASRESLDQNSPWNEFLMDFAGECLVDQVCQWRDSGGHDVDLYELLPLEREATDAGRPVARAVAQRAKQERLVFTYSRQWVYPHQARQLDKAKGYQALLELITPADLALHYQRPTDFVHPFLTGRARSLITALGVPAFGLSDLCDVLESASLLESKSIDWLIDLFVFLDTCREELDKTPLRIRLQRLPMIPIQGSRRAPAAALQPQHQVFLPLSAEMDEDYALFEGHLNLVARELLTLAQTKGATEPVQRFLHWLGVQPFEPYPVIGQVILSIFTGERWPGLSDGLRFGYVDFVRRHWPAYLGGASAAGVDESAASQRAAAALRFQRQGKPSQYEPAARLILTRAYQPFHDLEAQLAGMPDLGFVSDRYAAQEHTSQRAKSFVGPTWGDFLRDLGALERFEAARIIDDFVLPCLLAEAHPGGQWLALTNFIRQHLEVYEAERAAHGLRLFAQGEFALNDLKQSVRLMNGRGQFVPANQLYISRLYRDDADVAIAFGDLLADSYVSDQYLELTASGKDDDERRVLQLSWRKFLERLGILDHLRVQLGYWPPVLTQFFNQLGQIEPTRSRQARARALLRMLDRHWDDIYQPWARQNLASRFSEWAWIPTRAETLVRPGEQLYASKLADELDWPEHLCAEDVRNKSLRELLDIQTELSWEAVLALLRETRQQTSPRLENIHSLYRWLHNQWPEVAAQRESIRKQLRDLPYIYVPAGSPDWRPAADCAWLASPAALIARHRAALMQTYPDLHQFFVEQVGIVEEPGVTEALEVLTQHVAPEMVSVEEFPEVFRIYVELEKMLQRADPATLSLIPADRGDPLWLCADGRLRPTNEVYLNDHPGLFEIFQSQIHCLWLPDGQPPSSLETVLRQFVMARLSQAQLQLAGTPLAIAPNAPIDWIERLQKLTEPLLRYIHFHHYAVFRRAWDQGLVEKLYQVQPIITRHAIPIRYQLAHGQEAIHAQAVYMALDEAHIYLALDLKPEDTELSEELCRALGADREVQNFVDSLLPRLKSDVLDRFLKQKGLPPLPGDLAAQARLWGPASSPPLETELPDRTSPDSFAGAPFPALAAESSHPTQAKVKMDPEPLPPPPALPELTLPQAPLTENVEVPIFTGLLRPIVPVLPNNYGELQREFGWNAQNRPAEAVEIGASDSVAADGNWQPPGETNANQGLSLHPPSQVRFTLTFVNRFEGFLPLRAQAMQLLEDRPGRLHCLTDFEEWRFPLYADYERKILYNENDLPRFFAAQNIPAGGIVYLERVHRDTVRLFWKTAHSRLENVRCLELLEDGSLEPYEVPTAEFPCEVAEYVLRSEKRLEDSAALFKQALEQRGLFQTICEVFGAPGRELSYHEIHLGVISRRMVANFSIESQLARRPCFVDLGNRRWRFEPQRGSAPEFDDKPTEPRSEAKTALPTSAQTPTQPGSITPTVSNDLLRQHLERELIAFVKRLPRSGEPNLPSELRTLLGSMTMTVERWRSELKDMEGKT